MKGVVALSRAILTGLAWATAWVPVGMIVGAARVGELEPEHIGGALYPSFICGAIFAALAGIASGRSRLDEMPALRAAAWGAAAGAFMGSGLFVVGTGDVSDEAALWNTAIVVLASLAAALVASRGKLGALTPFQAGVLAAVFCGLLTGVRSWLQVYPSGIERYAPFAVIAGLSMFGALSACLSPPVYRWFKKQNSQVPQRADS